jgi:hypothetical protein
MKSKFMDTFWVTCEIHHYSLISMLQKLNRSFQSLDGLSQCCMVMTIIRKLWIHTGIRLLEKYKQNLHVSNEGPSSGS